MFVRRASGALAVLGVALATVAAAGESGPRSAVAFTRAQADRGAAEYATNCSACHGTRLDGGAGPALRGSKFSVRAARMQSTVGDVFATIARQMPLNQPASLSHAQYVAVVAYILHANGFAAGTAPLTYQAAMRSNVPISRDRR